MIIIMDKETTTIKKELKIVKLKEITIQNTTWHKKWEKVDTRRQIVGVVLDNDTIWYPKFRDIQDLNDAILAVFKHNIQYPNIDKLPKC